MEIIQVSFIILSVAVLVVYFNHYWLKMQTTIAVMMASLILSLVVLFTESFGWFSQSSTLIKHMQSIDFSSILMNGLLGMLLFAGSLSLNINAFKQAKKDIAFLSFGATLGSTVLLGSLLCGINHLITLYSGLSLLSPIEAFLFATLISPTDPIAVLATLKKLAAPQSLQVRLAGESLFNDGIGIVLFLSVYALVTHQGEGLNTLSIVKIFLVECLGGITYGAGIGYFVYRMIRHVDDPQLHVLLTLAVATGGYALANAIGVSGPLAMVVAGMFVANQGQQLSMPSGVVKNLRFFWEILDEILNVLLFFLLGFELVLLDLNGLNISVMLGIIPLVLAVRWLSVYGALSFAKSSCIQPLTHVLTWGGLRGGLAVALSLSIPDTVASKGLLLCMTYAVVVFSILVQGSTVSQVLKKCYSD